MFNATLADQNIDTINTPTEIKYYAPNSIDKFRIEDIKQDQHDGNPTLNIKLVSIETSIIVYASFYFKNVFKEGSNNQQYDSNILRFYSFIKDGLNNLQFAQKCCEQLCQFLSNPSGGSISLVNSPDKLKNKEVIAQVNYDVKKVSNGWAYKFRKTDKGYFAPSTSIKMFFPPNQSYEIITYSKSELINELSKSKNPEFVVDGVTHNFSDFISIEQVNLGQSSLPPSNYQGQPNQVPSYDIPDTDFDDDDLPF